MADILIRQFDVFRNERSRSKSFPYVAVLQADVVEGRSVVVAPLVPGTVVARSLLTPHVIVGERDWALIVSDLASLPRTALTRLVANLQADRRRIVLALNYLFTGV